MKLELSGVWVHVYILDDNIGASAFSAQARHGEYPRGRAAPPVLDSRRRSYLTSAPSSFSVLAWSGEEWPDWPAKYARTFHSQCLVNRTEFEPASRHVARDLWWYFHFLKFRRIKLLFKLVTVRDSELPSSLYSVGCCLMISSWCVVASQTKRVVGSIDAVWVSWSSKLVTSLATSLLRASRPDLTQKLVLVQQVSSLEDLHYCVYY